MRAPATSWDAREEAAETPFPSNQSACGAPEPRGRKGYREKILAASLELFRGKGYFPVSIEEIAAAADTSRMTVYRHFTGKAAIAGELFVRAAASTTPVYLRIADGDFRSYSAVRAWIVEIFATDRANRQLLRVFTQANAEHQEFTGHAQTFIADIVAGLGRSIPAFAIDRTRESQKRRWLEAWLLIYELLDQSNRAAWDRLDANEPLMIDIIATRFVEFVRQSTGRSATAGTAEAISAPVDCGATGIHGTRQHS
ncbi:TetR/AcrR family transcriptional regulator [Sphingomonas sp. BIUV-7]|uniref:TetR/AcrR family transcriptional regulator n=1 Tax=Sphingomonas natans TaxID=3063330 RepID=A0ABT8Y8B8_9SPHN|nr:TetR/AcrR family transcriptional regulator [Sphingomonas sp. BIUV-7]MDO6414560.1 TetR/AcrR family transcriptional regulator [Sphingomonas sp. BIUV-7]